MSGTTVKGTRLRLACLSLSARSTARSGRKRSSPNANSISGTTVPISVRRKKPSNLEQPVLKDKIGFQIRRRHFDQLSVQQFIAPALFFGQLIELFDRHQRVRGHI